MSFTGFTLERLRSPYAPAGAQELLEQLDIVIDGPFIADLATHNPDCPVASSNQRVHVLNPAFQNRVTWASDQLEVHVFPDGSRIVTGYYSQLAETEASIDG